MASKQTKVQHLAGISLFEGCSKKELEKVASAGDEILMTAGSVIVDQGQTGREAFVVLSGKVEVTRSKRKVADLGPGAVVGELSLLDHGPRTATVTCVTDCELLVIDQRNFRAVLQEVPTMTVKLLATIAGRIRDLDKKYYG
jgi:CRP-like cAMP-binding protein